MQTVLRTQGKVKEDLKRNL